MGRPVLLAVANLIRRDGVKLRRLLRLRTPIEDVPTAKQELAQAVELLNVKGKQC